mgnify:CR=1 FL=1
MNKTMLVTGSNGLIGSEVVRYFSSQGWKVYGIDNNMRADFFGPQGNTRWMQQYLLKNCQGYTHVEGSTIWDYNEPMKLDIEKYGGKIYKTYRIYTKKINK